MVKKAIVVKMTTTGAIVTTSAVGPALGLQLRALEQVEATEGKPNGTKLGPKDGPAVGPALRLQLGVAVGTLEGELEGPRTGHWTENKSEPPRARHSEPSFGRRTVPR